MTWVQEMAPFLLNRKCEDEWQLVIGPRSGGGGHGKLQEFWGCKGQSPKGTATTQGLLIVPMWEYKPSLARSFYVSGKVSDSY